MIRHMAGHHALRSFVADKLLLYLRKGALLGLHHESSNKDCAKHVQNLHKQHPAERLIRTSHRLCMAGAPCFELLNV
jgi:hypothetical protein